MIEILGSFTIKIFIQITLELATNVSPPNTSKVVQYARLSPAVHFVKSSVLHAGDKPVLKCLRFLKDVSV